MLYQLEKPPLLYKYPEANPSTWLNIVEEMLTNKDFYTKIWHLMNILNMHPPFVQDFTPNEVFIEKIKSDKSIARSLKDRLYPKRSKVIIEKIEENSWIRKREEKARQKENELKSSKSKQISGVMAKALGIKDKPHGVIEANNTDALLARIESEYEEHSDSNQQFSIIDKIIEVEWKRNRKGLGEETVELIKKLKNTIEDKNHAYKESKAKLVDLKKKFQKYGQGVNHTEDMNDQSHSTQHLSQL